ncbi:MAG: EVE domain-containing protein [Isosphaeraceae bacterium]
MAYWLFKSRPNCFSFADLEGMADRTTGWDGVRNFQARNFLRDDIKVGDRVLFYHSSTDPPAVAGIAEVVREGHADPTAFDPDADHYDPKSDPASPTWYQVSIRAVRDRPSPGAVSTRSGPHRPWPGWNSSARGAGSRSSP